MYGSEDDFWILVVEFSTDRDSGEVLSVFGGFVVFWPLEILMMFSISAYSTCN